MPQFTPLRLTVAIADVSDNDVLDPTGVGMHQVLGSGSEIQVFDGASDEMATACEKPSEDLGPADR